MHSNRQTQRRTVGWGECNEPQHVWHVCGDGVYVGVREFTPTYELQRITTNHEWFKC